MAWVYLLGAGVLEVVWAVALKFADGFTRFWPSAICLVATAASFYLLSLAFRTLNAGTAYSVWVGIGTVGVATVGILVLGESSSPRRLFFLALILVGIVGLRVTDGAAP